VNFDALFKWTPTSSESSVLRGSNRDATHSLNRAGVTYEGDRIARTRPTASSGTSASGAQNGVALDRFQRTLEGRTRLIPPPRHGHFYYPYYDPFFNPYGGYYPGSPPEPYPYPPMPGPEPTPDDGGNPDDYRIGEHGGPIDPLAEQAAQDIRTAWLNNDMDLISKHIRRDVRIDIYVGHQLEKTRDASDFLNDMRYAFDTKTVQFQIESLSPVTRTLYKLTARRTTSDLKGDEQTVTLRYFLKKMDGAYVITRAETDD